MLAINLERARKYCAYQERCHSEVRSKLIEWKIFGEELEQIIATLISENFLNEERYARAFVSGKFNINHWGRQKITYALKQRQVSEYSIRKGLEVIDEEEYQQLIRRLLERRMKEKKTQSPYQLTQYLMSRGFEYNEIEKVLSHDA
ncbi:MAG: RecX family transcriptional regulator [Saprospiraceae bacterium]|nr:RecX family transcriptional regulator [Saprospiraceae bacterium]